ARVLPLPVGAWIRVWRPVEMDAQPPTWAGVGASNDDSNQARTAGENGASGSTAPGRLGAVGLLRVGRAEGGRVVAVTGGGVYSRMPVSIGCSIREGPCFAVRRVPRGGAIRHVPPDRPRSMLAPDGKAPGAESRKGLRAGRWQRFVVT